MKIILDRRDIEEAVEAYVKDKYLPYGDVRELHIVQGSKASAVITFKQEEKLPGLDCPNGDCQDTEVETETFDPEPDIEDVPEEAPFDTDEEVVPEPEPVATKPVIPVFPG